MSNKLINWSIFILLCFIWGSSFILMKISNQGLSAPQIASLRIFSAGIVFIPFAFFHMSNVLRKKIGLLLLTGLFGNLLPAFCFTIALLKIDSSLTGILNSLTPICVVVLGILFFRDKIKTKKIIGVLIGLAGLSILTFTQNTVSLENFGYSLLVLLATISYGLNVNLVSHYLKDVKPLHIATISLAFMTIPAGWLLWQYDFLVVDFSNNRVQWAVFNSILLGLASSALGTVLFYILVQRATGLFASLVTYGIPFIALFWGYLDGEILHWIDIFSLAIILTGVFMANQTDN